MEFIRAKFSNRQTAPIERLIFQQERINSNSTPIMQHNYKIIQFTGGIIAIVALVLVLYVVLFLGSMDPSLIITGLFAVVAGLKAFVGARDKRKGT